MRTDRSELWIALDHLRLVEEGDERLVSGRDEHELERVAVERNALQCVYDGLKNGAARNYSDVS